MQFVHILLRYFVWGNIFVQFVHILVPYCARRQHFLLFAYICVMKCKFLLIAALLPLLFNVARAQSMPGDSVAVTFPHALDYLQLETSTPPQQSLPTQQPSTTRALHKFSGRQLVAPVILVGLGVVGSQIDDFKELDFGLRPHDLHTHNGFVFEDALQYAPLGAMYLLKVAGVTSAHSYLDATVLAVGSFCVTGAAVFLLKEFTDVQRPNRKDFDSFPSGHAAKAFMGAELLRREFKDTSPAIGYAGYAAATVTSLLRVKHSEHWLPDILVGAGIGILGTQVAYWVAPHLQKWLFGGWIGRKGLRSGDFAFVGMPFYNGKVQGVSLALVF